MPLIEIHLAEGRTKDQKEKLLRAVTTAVHDAIDAPVSSIRVWIQEFPKDEYMAAGELLSERGKQQR
ncbi:MAG: 2-hydroxymuconate tautomerase [Myxococcota bacterium]|nr:2-hydroxymuconate tautomerase [Myxococcota bacterium]